MVNKPDERRKPEGSDQPTVIDLCSDEDNNHSPAPPRNNGASSKQKRLDGSRPKSSQKQTTNRQLAPKPAAATPTVDLTSTHSGSQPSHARSQQQSRRSTPSALISTLAERIGSRDPSNGGQLPRLPSSSSGKATSPPASQVQISRGIHRPSSTVPPRTSSANASLAPTENRKKRSLEREGEVGESPAAKRLKSSQGHGQSSGQPAAVRHSSALSGMHHSGGNDSNPIVLSDSPPPKTNSNRHASQSLPNRQRTPKPLKAPVPKSTGRPPITSSTPRSTNPASERGNPREGIDVEETVKSPTIPESLPGSSPERNRTTGITGPQSPTLPLFIRPSDKVSDENLGADIETISSFASQVLGSQTDDMNGTAPATTVATTAATPATQRKKPEDNRTLPSSHSDSLEDTRQSSTAQVTSSTALREHPGKGKTRMLVSDIPPTLPVVAGSSPNTIPKNTDLASHIEQVIHKYVQELRADNIYWTRTWLKRARNMAKEPKWSGHAPTSVFRDMKPIEPIPVTEGSKTTEVFARLTVEAFNASGGKAQSRRCFDLPCTMYHTPTDADVPNYSHFVNIKHSFLAQNETVLQHWPYFHDDFDMKDAKELEEQYYLDVKGRERKLKRLAQAENYAEYVEDMLRDIGCAWSDVLRFLLDPEPDVGTNPQALAALRARDRFCDEDFVRGGQRWTTVLSKLPLSIDPERVGKAALLCEHFLKIAKFQLWHVARRSDYTAKLLKEEEKPKPDLDEITCRVCMRFCCPDHGEIHENPSGGSDSERDGSADEDVVETDIIHPYRVNYRSRVSLPSTVDNVELGTATEIDPKRKRVEYWFKQNLNHYPDDRRGPFYPCHHPGMTCDKVQCSCFLNRIPCEKSCACPPSCKRKWQGCECRRKGSSNIICFEDARCACFQYGRECDADLCGECGVLDVLDPVHRHDDRVLQNRCHNASIQRGVPRHTILGDSGIHGLGLYACEDIQPHDFVGEYKGEIITKEEAERRGAVYEHQKLSYLFSLNKKQEVDSTLFGNKMRFINHALLKEANLYPRIIMVNTVFRIALYGARKINAGQELFFDYGDQFPQDQLGGKAGKERKAAPHVRNKNLLEHFDKVVTDTDKFGNRRARKAASDNKRGKLAVKGSGAGSTNGSVVTRKSTVFRPSSSRGVDVRSGAERSRLQPLDRAANLDNDEKSAPQNQFEAIYGRRLYQNNIVDDDDAHPDHGDDEEDDDFTPRSSDDRRFEETSSVDGGDEDEDDDDDEGMRPAPTRSRSSRIRKFE